MKKHQKAPGYLILWNIHRHNFLLKYQIHFEVGSEELLNLLA